MAEKGSPKESVAKYAQRIDPKREKLSPEQQEFMRKTEMAQWRKNAGKLRGRNLVTGLVIGGIVLGICILPMFHDKQRCSRQTDRLLTGMQTGTSCSSTVSTCRLLSMFLNSVYMEASLHVPQQCLHEGFSPCSSTVSTWRLL
eukprot:XP_012826977.1 PREDICTED: coiled-coil domain containing 56 isoform X2 [Xenopus tropicalis]